MEFQPNKEQSDFIDSMNSNVLVSASAGSGKTSTMIQKLIHLLVNEKINISNLLVLTYTEAAANEIKVRLFNEITKVISTCNDENREFLKVQLDNINSAEIGTLHSVCKKLIVKYFYEIGVSPDFSVLPEKESKYLLDLSISKVFERHILNADELFFDLYNSYNTKRNDTSLKQIVINLYTYISNRINAKLWIDSVTDKIYNTDLNTNIVCLELQKYFSNILKNEYVARISDIISICKSQGYDKYLDFLYNRKNIIDSIIESKNFLEFVKIISNIEFLKKPIKPRNGTPEELDFDECVDNLNKDISDIIKQIKINLVCDNERDILDNFQTGKANVLKLIELVFEIKQEYEIYKNKKNALDFNDLEDKMLELVSIEKVREKLKTDYKFIFFDEYQDINEKQEAIISYLVSDNNYYMIGDVKQSIYAFRQSSPEIFINKFYKFKTDGGINKVINFNKNYRSDINILEFNNLIFDTLITEKTIGINYKENSRFESNKTFDKCNVDIKIIDTNDEDIESSEKEQKEAMLVAEAIADLIGKPKSDGSEFTYNDIAIIIRNRGSLLKSLCDMLTTMQIPIKTTISRDFFGTPEICLMVSIIKVIANYKDDISLCVVLKNLFELSDSELLKIRQNAGQGYFYDAIKDCIDGEISDKIRRFFEFINDSSIYLANHTIKEFLLDTISRFDIITYQLSMPNGKERISNIEEFISLSDGENFKYNLDKFIEYLDFISKDDARINIATGGNAVEISTIHHSKGLEYPAVIMCGLGKKFNINKDTNNIIINEKFGVGLKCIDSNNRTLNETLVRNLCKIKNKHNELNEEIRLLYVAMTRPKEYLCLIGQYDLDDYAQNKSKSIYSSKNYFDMIFKSFDDVYDSNMQNRKNFILNEGENSQARVEIKSLKEINLESDKIKHELFLGNVNNDLREDLKNYLQTNVNRETNTIKNTVTNILREEIDYENLNYSPKKLDISDRPGSIDYLELGNAYHSVMQNVNFTENKEQIDELINRLVANNIINPEIKSSIDVDKIILAIQNLKDLIKYAETIYREKQFIMQENYNKLVKNSDNKTKVFVQGVIDLVVKTNDNVYLIDYKTNKNVTTEFLKQEYSLQLEIYAKAFEKATNLPVTKKYLYSFWLNELIEVN